MNVVLGITGGVGCGKSSVGRLLERLGARVLDADDVARRQLDPGSEAYDAVVARFPESRGPDGRLNRPRIAARVFADAGDRDALHAAVHPAVLREMRAWVREHRGAGPLAAIVPLLYEVGFTDPWDAVLCVAADPAVVADRVRARGWTAGEAARRQASQWPLDEKIRRADFVIWNNGSQAELEADVKRVWQELRKRSA